MEPEEIKCPFCGSDEVSKPRISRAALAFTMFLGFPLPFMRKWHHCFDCGHDFKNEKKEKVA